MSWHDGHRPSSARWERVRRIVLNRDGWRCTKCGRAGRLEVHHKHHLEHHGPMYDQENLVTMCRACHINEHRKPRPRTPSEAAWDQLLATL